MKKAISLLLCFILFSCADSGQIESQQVLKQKPFAQTTIVKKGFKFYYKIYEDTFTNYGRSLVYVFIDRKQKKNLPENYIEYINQDGHEFINKHCPNYPNIGFFEMNVKAKDQHIIASSIACHLE